MNVLKIIGVVILVLIALPLIVAVFVPGSYTLSVSETIDRPRDVVYDYVRILKNQENYSVWVMQVPDFKPDMIGADGTVGAVQRWNSPNKKVGEGEQEITSLSPDRMDVDLRFVRPFKGTARAANFFEPLSENQTLITSEFYTSDPYPVRLMSYFIGRRMVRKVMVDNLSNLKRILQSN
jgi:hypothetical protein